MLYLVPIDSVGTREDKLPRLSPIINSRSHRIPQDGGNLPLVYKSGRIALQQE